MFPYKRATIDCGFEFVNNIESINLNLVIKCFLAGMGFLSHGGVVPSSRSAEPKDYIYSVACEV